jgi:hypothetical protein
MEATAQRAGRGDEEPDRAHRHGHGTPGTVQHGSDSRSLFEGRQRLGFRNRSAWFPDEEGIPFQVATG